MTSTVAHFHLGMIVALSRKLDNLPIAVLVPKISDDFQQKISKMKLKNVFFIESKHDVKAVFKHLINPTSPPVIDVARIN